MKLPALLLMAFFSLNAMAQDKTNADSTAEVRETIIEEYEVSDLIAELDQRDYLISGISNPSGVCKYLTENKSATAIGHTKEVMSSYLQGDLEVDPYQYVEISPRGELLGFVKTTSVLGKRRHFSKIICSYLEE